MHIMEQSCTLSSFTFSGFLWIYWWVGRDGADFWILSASFPVVELCNVLCRKDKENRTVFIIPQQYNDSNYCFQMNDQFLMCNVKEPVRNCGTTVIGCLFFCQHQWTFLSWQTLETSLKMTGCHRIDNHHDTSNNMVGVECFLTFHALQWRGTIWQSYWLPRADYGPWGNH